MTLEIRAREECAYDAVSLGEVMLRLDPGEGRIRTAREFKVWEGGGEYNVRAACGGASATRPPSSPRSSTTRSAISSRTSSCRAASPRDFIKWREDDGIGRTVRNGLNFTERGFGVRGAWASPTAATPRSAS